jgi:hypothetical protein
MLPHCRSPPIVFFSEFYQKDLKGKLKMAKYTYKTVTETVTIEVDERWLTLLQESRP